VVANLLVNIDVPDMDSAIAFYTAALGLTVGRRFDTDFVELLGRDAPIYLLRKDAGTSIGPAGGDARRYQRHWTPIHPDFVVENIAGATARVLAAGALQEGETFDAPYGKLAMFADPFGHGFCLIEFSAEGYNAILP
jgi:lactoylglutathione lyase